MTSNKPAHNSISNPGASPWATVMIVEDDEGVRRLAARILKKAGHIVVEAGSVDEARALWPEHKPQIALVDLALPGEEGSVLLKEEWVRSLETVVVVVTGSDDIELADRAFEEGAYGYVVKPYTPNELLMQVHSALRRRNLELAATEHVRELERKVIESGAAVREIRTQIDSMATVSPFAEEEVIRRLSSAVCLRDDETGRHIERVSVMAAALADWYGFKVDPAPAVRMAAAMHDVGKIGIPDWILLKPGRLSDEERTTIERHCELGHSLLSGSESPILKLAASVALNHHERWDGRGYPNRVSGEEIPTEARITSVVDVFDALTHDRVYRSALPVDTAVDIMVRDREGLFDPKLLDLFLHHLDDAMALTEKLSDPVVTRLTRIVIVDDERVLVEGLIRLINRKDEMRVIGTANSVEEALEAVRTLRPDVLLSDYRMSDGDGAGLAEEVLANYPETKVIVLTGMATPEVALRCIAAGCSGVLSKTSPVNEVADAIRRVHDGEVVIPAALLPKVVSGLRRTGPSVGADITTREHELLEHLARGLSLQDIATAMSISMNTARNHTQRVIEKLGAHSKLEAVIIATRERIISVD